ncbi:4'-phosphopantetheinyl transferase [Irpex rosettiformis]|uniref:4'-phosphopantetheinyl transferase n=1 Tax=Irpex rosettiformis TaxID=378272 RepID=A0ACB8UEX0_9APHY|nr:4'-phosphopantetheinyl transferase [Irpex rosettiformis]
MGMLGIGVDVVNLPRIAALVKRRTAQKLASRILSANEWEDWLKISHADPAQQVRFLAVRWSLKEAAYKAMFPHVQPTWKELTYSKLNAERLLKPALEYTPFQVTQNKIGRIHCSVSHDGEYVFTSVLVEEHRNELSS